MINIIVWIVLALIASISLFILYLKSVPHGWVQLRSGIVLKFLPPLDSLPVVKLRHSLEDFVAKQRPKILSELPVRKVNDIEIPTRYGHIAARIYRHSENQPTHNIVFIHGGGWCIGSVNSYEEVCRRLARTTELPVISLDYSLAPEHKFPQAHDECLDAVNWIGQNEQQIGLDALPIVMVGDSAGGNLIVATYYDLTDPVRSKIDKMVPVYPAVDGVNGDYYSSKAYAKGYYLTKKSMNQFTEGLVNHIDETKDVRLTPLYQPAISDFPKSLVILADFDPLRDQGIAFAKKIKTEGNNIMVKKYQGTIHAFFGLKGFGDRGVKAIEDIALFIRGNVPDNLYDLSNN